MTITPKNPKTGEGKFEKVMAAYHKDVGDKRKILKTLFEGLGNDEVTKKIAGLKDADVLRIFDAIESANNGKTDKLAKAAGAASLLGSFAPGFGMPHTLPGNLLSQAGTEFKVRMNLTNDELKKIIEEAFKPEPEKGREPREAPPPMPRKAPER